MDVVGTPLSLRKGDSVPQRRKRTQNGAPEGLLSRRETPGPLSEVPLCGGDKTAEYGVPNNWLSLERLDEPDLAASDGVFHVKHPRFGRDYKRNSPTSPSRKVRNHGRPTHRQAYFLGLAHIAPFPFFWVCAVERELFQAWFFTSTTAWHGSILPLHADRPH